MMTAPPAMPPAIGPMEEPLLEAAGGEGAATSGLVRSATGTVTAGKPWTSTTTLTAATFAPTPAATTYHMLKAEVACEKPFTSAVGDALQCNCASAFASMSASATDSSKLLQSKLQT